MFDCGRRRTFSIGMETQKQILEALPYKKPFLFVDQLSGWSNQGISGEYTLQEHEYFYQGHFEGNPITPGVILIEIAAQIGLVCLAIYLLISENKQGDYLPTFSQANVNFILPVLPGERVTIVSEKVYFRFNKLKCRVKMYNESRKVVCEGYLSGFIVPNEQVV